jgi:hypothetical protein
MNAGERMSGDREGRPYIRVFTNENENPVVFDT